MASQPDLTETDSRASEARPGGVTSQQRTELPEIDPDNYDVHGEIARGGMGRILRATDRRLGREVAIKKLLVSTNAHARLFEREIRISARLQHPAIVNIYEAGRLPSGELFYAMKLVTGRSLSRAIDDTETLGERVALLPAVTAVCDALAYAHRQRIIHRDLKPSNVLVGDFGETVVIDWGLAKDLDSPDDNQAIADSKPVAAEHTVSGHAVGTPAYMPPEQARGDDVDERSDVYALGAMIYHVLSARAPYRGDHAKDIVAQVRAGPPPPLESIEASLPNDLYTLVARAMSRDPAERYASAVELVDDLRRFQTGKLISAHRYSRRELFGRWVARHRAVVSVVAAAVVVLAVLLVVGISRIVRERDVASSRADRLTLTQARLLLDRDPAGAIATLQTLPLDAGEWGAARVIAAAARDRGIGEVRLRQDHGISLIAAAPADDAIAAASEDGAVVIIQGTHEPQLLWTHAGPVTALAFDASGRWLASASRDATIQLRDRHSGESYALDEHELPVVHLAFSSDGAALASVDSGGNVVQWDTGARTARTLPSMRPPIVAIAFARDASAPTVVGRQSGAPITRAEFSADGSRIAAVTTTNDVRVTTPGAPDVHLPATAEHLLFSPDASLLATSDGTDAGAVVWNIASGESVPLRHTAVVGSLAFLAGGELIATGGRDGTIRVWRLDGALVRELRGHQAEVVTMAVSPGGDVLYSGSADRSVRAWPVLPLSPRRLAGHTAGIARVAFGGDGNTLVSAGWDSTVRVWETPNDVARVIGAHVGALRALAVEGNTIASGGDDRAVRVWSIDASVERTLGTHLAAVLSVALSPDGTQVVSGGRDNAVRTWSVDGSATRVFSGHSGAVNEVAFSADGRWIASASADGTARAWNLADDIERVITHDEAVEAVAFSPDSTWLASAGHDGKIRITKLDSGTSTVLEGHTDTVRDLDVSADGRHLASASDDMTARVWDIGRGSSRVFVGHRDYVSRVRFDPRAFAIVTASEDGTLSMWDIDSGTNRVLAADGWLGDIAFSRDGTQIASCGADDVVFVWRNDLPIDARGLHAWLIAEVPR